MAKRKKRYFIRRRRARPTSRRLLKPVTIRSETGYQPQSWTGLVASAKDGRYRVDERKVIGDAPKDFLWVHDSSAGKARLSEWRRWPAYIAKVGHKLYPSESITEHVITRVGQLCGLAMADSRLLVCAGQVRFLSRYFLRDNEILYHGAQILAGYLSDKQFVDRVADVRAEKDLFTFQVFCTAIRGGFPDHARELVLAFVRMIGFDAIVGNQDRHFYNWGVITHPSESRVPRFAPIYDSARGLFWNTPEVGLAKFHREDSLRAYIRRSEPLIGWDAWDQKRGGLNHFHLIERIASADDSHRRCLLRLASRATASMNNVEGMINAEFVGMLSDQRRALISRCLRLRVEEFTNVLRGI